MRFVILALVGLAAAWLVFTWRSRRERIAPAAARALVEQGALLIDVRSPHEFAAGHIPGARNVPLPQLAEHVAALPGRDRAIVVYCKSGMRSRIAATRLRDSGFAAVHDLGPASAWPS